MPLGKHFEYDHKLTRKALCKVACIIYHSFCQALAHLRVKQGFFAKGCCMGWWHGMGRAAGEGRAVWGHGLFGGQALVVPKSGICCKGKNRSRLLIVRWNKMGKYLCYGDTHYLSTSVLLFFSYTIKQRGKWKGDKKEICEMKETKMLFFLLTKKALHYF